MKAVEGTRHPQAEDNVYPQEGIWVAQASSGKSTGVISELGLRDQGWHPDRNSPGYCGWAPLWGDHCSSDPPLGGGALGGLPGQSTSFCRSQRPAGYGCDEGQSFPPGSKITLLSSTLPCPHFAGTPPCPGMTAIWRCAWLRPEVRVLSGPPRGGFVNADEGKWGPSLQVGWPRARPT